MTEGNACYSLADAEYGVYKDAACKNRVATLKTDASGNTNPIKVPIGTYYVKETKASTGYNLDPLFPERHLQGLLLLYQIYRTEFPDGKQETLSTRSCLSKYEVHYIHLLTVYLRLEILPIQQHLEHRE